MLRIAFFFSLIFAAFSCGFEKLKHPPLQVIKSKTHDQSDTGRSLQQAYENIRFHVDYSYLESIDPVQRDYIQNQIMPSAISYYQTALQIVRSADGVQVDVACGGYDPPAYLVDPGVDADLVILVAAENMPDVDFVAGAVPCGISDTDSRPNYGLMLWNLAYLPMEKVTDDQENLSTALHELAHIIGFNPDVFPYFRNPETGEILTDIVGTKQVNGWNVTYLNVEPLTSRLRAYFACDTLEGAYLEDEGETGSIGSHFERRVFMNEFMTASSITEPVISEFTLALFEGSGWYRTNYNMTEPFSWGRGQGCAFLDSNCLNDQGGPAFPQFCDANAPFGCSYTSRGVGFCTLDSPDFFANNCPYYAASVDTDCEDPANQARAYITAESYGPNSRCFTGTLVEPIYVPTSGAFCFPSICTPTADGFTLTLTVNGVDLVCAGAGPVSIEGYSGQLDCPDPNEFCNRANPVFCEKGCSGRGTCVDNVCQCPPGWVGVDCAERTFDETCERCQSEAGTGCFGDECVTADQVSPAV